MENEDNIEGKYVLILPTQDYKSGYDRGSEGILHNACTLCYCQCLFTNRGLLEVISLRSCEQHACVTVRPSSVAICQEGQSERTFAIFAFSS